MVSAIGQASGSVDFVVILWSAAYTAVKHPAEASMAKAGKHQKWRETAATLLAV